MEHKFPTTPKEFADMLSTLTEYPLFASMNEYRSEDKTYQEWLESIPQKMLFNYSEHILHDSDKPKKKIMDQDILVTVMVLHAMSTNNDPINTDDLVWKVLCFQRVLCSYVTRKDYKDMIGLGEDLGVKGGSWEDFLGWNEKKSEDS